MSILVTQRIHTYAINQKLSEFKFKEADELFYELIKSDKTNYSILDKYEELRRKYVEKFFHEKVILSKKFDNEQLSAISSIYKNTLVSARAGSGKTKVIAGKIAFSILGEGIKPNEILTLSFNKKAAQEISERLIQEREGFNIKDYDFSQTFHGLCYNIVRPKSEILVDIEKFEDPKKGITIEYSTKKQQKFIQKSFLSEFENIRKYLEDELCNEYRHLKKDGIHLEENEFYNQRISKPFAFTGNYVRSKGERYILDFLVEFGFSNIKYEPVVNINGSIGKPDIYCTYKGVNLPIYIEHWGSDGEWKIKVPEHWGINGKEKYDQNKIKKQQFFHEKSRKGECIFIETNIRNIEYGTHERELFYIFLKKLFEERLGFQLIRKAKSQIVEDIKKNNHYIYPIVKKIQQYIQKAQFQRKNPEQMRQEIINYNNNSKIDKETRAFLFVANIVYRRYEKDKINLSTIDFNELIELGIKKIKEHNGDVLVRVNEGEMNLKNLKYILIDEYQDFSPLFYEIIKTIKEYNSNFKLFVVGDDWQAINSFAGSELRYFIDFLKIFEGEMPTERIISTNYRSTKNIVQSGNLIMKKIGGKESIPYSSEIGNKIKYIDTSKNNNYKFDFAIIDKIFPIKESDGKKSASIELKRNIFQEILNIINTSIKESKTALILSRNNTVYTEQLGEWKMKIEEYYRQLIYKQDIQEEFKQKKLEELQDIFLSGKIEFLTCHKSKGKQADNVVILDASKKHFPINEDEMKDDKNYFEIFNDTSANILINERKLFYVALTRAKQQQYIFYEPGKETTLISELQSLSN